MSNIKRMTKKEFLTDYLLSIVLEMAVLFGLIGFFAIFIDRGDIIQEVKTVGSEMSSPTAGRLFYFILSFVLSLAITVIASRLAQKGKDVPAFWCGFAAGILLWQSVGEASWHFQVDGTNFTVLENIMSFPLVLLFIGLLIYGHNHRCFDWGVWIMIVSFACNWLGHYVTIGIYPFLSGLTDSHTWNVLAGSIVGGILFILSILFLITHQDTKKGRMFASILTYIAMGVISFSIMDG